LTLEDSGISKYNLDVIKKIVKEPYGIILISGPTGSGKSTTLRGMIGEVDTLTENVMSLEDPIEYNLDGVSQSQVRPEIGYTFATGLRAALRQDPDIIMVGEIRDKETAQLAIQAALTGHLVLSTIHTNNAIGVIPRLIDMGVDPYLIAPTLKMAIAQRLSKKLCDGTGVEVEIDSATQERIKGIRQSIPSEYSDRIPDSTTMLHPEPTPTCSTGYRGRTAVTEVLEITTEIQELILKSAPEEDFLASARKNGFTTIQEDAMIKALNHEIPLEEMLTFGTQINIDELLEEPAEVLVDNQTPGPSDQAIMNSNEDEEIATS
jgi:type IV pilus assembly protein PilB